MSRYAFEGFKKGRLILTGVYSHFVKKYCNLGNAIKVGKQLVQNTENTEVSIIGIDHKGIATNWVKLDNLV
jgi:archaellum component FlaF (FlaF/FlaG flagellin family)